MSASESAEAVERRVRRAKRHQAAAERAVAAVTEALEMRGWRRVAGTGWGWETPDGVRLHVEPDVWPAE
jgi:hypothetical protein